MKNKAEHDLNHQQAEMPDMPYGVSGFLAWVLLWFRLCLGGDGYRYDERVWQAPANTRQPNRHQQRMWHAKISPARTYGPYYILAGRGKTPGQYAEWLAQYSGRGRVSVYRMRYWRKTVKGKAAPLGTEHEYWCDPLERLGKHASKLSCGIWAGHLWPEWKNAPSPNQIQRPE